MVELEYTRTVLRPGLSLASKEVKPGINKRFLVKYKDLDLLLTFRQMEIISLISMGYSNLKIAKKTKVRESAVKLMIYRLVKYLDRILEEKIDRFYLIVLSQEIVKYFEENYSQIKLLNN